MKRNLIVLLVLLLAVLTGCQNQQTPVETVTVGGTEYPADLKELNLYGTDPADPRGLSALQQLELLDLRHTRVSPEDYDYLCAQLPKCQILWELPFRDGFLAQDTKKLALSGLTREEALLLTRLKQLETLDLSLCPDPEVPEMAAEVLPQCRILYRVELGGIHWNQDARHLNLTEATPEALSAALPRLPQVEAVTLLSPIADGKAMGELVSAFPAIDFTYDLEFFGRTVSNKAAELSIAGTALESTEIIDELMPNFPNLTKLDMCGCGISDADMAALNQRWENTLFVWEVRMGHIKVRSDVTYFMPFQYNYKLTDKDADQLKYLTEVICIDFGHMDISRTDYLAYMTKLQFLLMCDTDIHDLTPVANLKELKYAELFITQIKDLSPLLECPKLVDLNLGYTFPDNPEILAQMTQLENLYYRGVGYGELYTLLKTSLPNCNIVPLSENESSTGSGWRDLPNYFAQRDLMGLWYMTG